MKTLALLLLSLALGSSLKAQSNPQLLTNSYPIQNQSLTSTGSAELQSVQNVQISEALSDLSGVECTEAEAPEAETLLNAKPKKRKNHNKGYSIAGEVSYTTGIGFYTGSLESGISVKHFIKSNTAIEGMLGASWISNGLRLTALYQVQKHIGTDGFYWYWGVGAHAGSFSEEYWNKGDCIEGRYMQNGKWYSCDGNRTTLGVAGVLGMEYQFDNLPFTISLGLRPAIDLLGKSNYYGDGTLAFRYAF